MKLLFLCTHPLLAWKNGADIAALRLARQLEARGHSCSFALVLLDNQPALDAWRRARGGAGDSFALGGIPVEVQRVVPPSVHPSELHDACMRVVDAAVSTILGRARPDVVVVPWGTLELARAARRHHDRVLVLIQNADAVAAFDADSARGLAVATVSGELTAQVAQRIGREPLTILNPIERDVIPATGTRDRIGMVNLCAEKGAIVFLNVARNLPDRRFIACGGWAGRAVDYTVMKTRLANVEIVPPFDDIAELYQRLRVLLVPSLVQEAFGRVVIEAQLAGVPVVCTARCPARSYVDPGFVVPVPARASGVEPERYYHDAELHQDTIRGFLDALVTLDDPHNHAIAVAESRAHAERYLSDQAASIDRLERWLQGPSA